MNVTEQEKEERVVYVARPRGGKPDRRVVKTGISDDVNTEITQGLKPGETVVLAGLDKFGIESFTTRR